MSDVPLVRRRGRIRRPAPAIEPLDASDDLPLELQVYNRLRRALIAGRIVAGTNLSVRSIAEAMGVSNAPVRDALKRLEADGALLARPRSAFYTPPVSLAEYDSILAVRVCLEGLAAAEAATRASLADIRAIEAALGTYRAALELGWNERLSQANHGFHFAIYQAAGNSVLSELIATLWVRMGPILARARPSPDEDSVHHHARALDAIKRRDPQLARQAIEEDLIGAARMIRQTIVEAQLADSS
jgi:DNA-binding GntR family transcriptional regulator